MRTSIIRLRRDRDNGQHAGLLLQRYLCENATGENGQPEEKRVLLQAAIKAANHLDTLEIYHRALNRWQASLPQQTARTVLRTIGRLIVGLGTENVLETGIRLHHTFGMPLIPGSAIKGLAAHFCDQVWGATDQKFRSGADYHQVLFGTNDDSGCIIFHDAWFVPESQIPALYADVMTPHHLNWLDGSQPPTDFDSPTPVPFLSVAGQFCVAVSWYGPTHVDAQKWTTLAKDLLIQALGEWGIGGKTSSGYGRMMEDNGLLKRSAVTTASSLNSASQASPNPQKRPFGTPVKVRITGSREKGFDVQEQGRPPGSLTVGNKPADFEATIGDYVDVEVHNDDPRKPQYRWPGLPTAKPKNQPRNRGR
jgi:CRISPR-associated protein Cmr6